MYDDTYVESPNTYAYTLHLALPQYCVVNSYQQFYECFTNVSQYCTMCVHGYYLRCYYQRLLFLLYHMLLPVPRVVTQVLLYIRQQVSSVDNTFELNLVTVVLFFSSSSVAYPQVMPTNIIQRYNCCILLHSATLPYCFCPTPLSSIYSVPPPLDRPCLENVLPSCNYQHSCRTSLSAVSVL